MTDMQQNVMSDGDVVLRVDHVSKSFRLPTEQATGLKMAFLNWTKGIKGYTEQHVLNDISFEVHRGDFFGIVGRNGSGKSTLLKIISQIYQPEHGSVEVNGKLVPFIELGVGFNPELTGRENVYLNGALLGFSHAQVDAMYDDIVEFAELGDFMDQKLKNYSSGMQVRLAFSVAIKAQGDILVLDEVLAVGDEAFQKKCDQFFKSVKEDPSKTVILVTHSMASMKRYCNKAVLIKEGYVAESGDPKKVADQYSLENAQHNTIFQTQSKQEHKHPTGLNSRVPVLKVLNHGNTIVDGSQDYDFDIEYQFNEQVPAYLGVILQDARRGGQVYDIDSQTNGKGTPIQPGHHTVHFSIPLNLMNNGEYRLFATLRVDDKDDADRIEYVAFTNDDNCAYFAIRNEHNGENGILNDTAMQFSVITA
ncbi:polysaccharide ABC transporter ATP-binding protein [Bifidobacterium stellenboschense]|uniref:Sugar ABC transporter n=1 Tax=Bifidobacterium stellenboschense TaxID=762211 RepID=A0A087DN15_9BIFI|nr:polysaccharide ABC transporter ATP-binding protein [Bifidobacterium stellenboschense]KFI96915.1 sugar ABC transporter [Bifidobacterium stellenboschense]